CLFLSIKFLALACPLFRLRQSPSLTSAQFSSSARSITRLARLAAVELPCNALLTFNFSPCQFAIDDSGAYLVASFGAFWRIFGRHSIWRHLSISVRLFCEQIILTLLIFIVD